MTKSSNELLNGQGVCRTPGLYEYNCFPFHPSMFLSIHVPALLFLSLVCQPSNRGLQADNSLACAALLCSAVYMGGSGKCAGWGTYCEEVFSAQCTVCNLHMTVFSMLCTSARLHTSHVMPYMSYRVYTVHCVHCVHCLCIQCIQGSCKKRLQDPRQDVNSGT